MIAEIVLCFIVSYLILYLFKPKKNFPPGPWSIPFIGQAALSKVEQCTELQKKYGNMFMLRVGSYNFLYILDYKMSKEAFSKFEFANRPNFCMLHFFQGEREQEKPNGVIFSTGTHWSQNRRFLLRHLRDLGMGKSRMEGVIMREAESLVENFKLLIDKPTKLPMSIHIAILNVVWQLVSGHRYKFSDKKVEGLMNSIDDVRKLIYKVAVPDVFSVVRYILPEFLLNYLTGKNEFRDAIMGFENIVQPVIDEHLAKLDPNNPVDLMDDYLIEMKIKKSEEFKHFNLIDLTRLTFDLFLAGNDTTANMVRWVLLYMAKYPLIQKKVQEEIDSVVERDSFPGLQHKEKLVYLDATINEVQRHSSMFSFGVLRSVASDTVLGGYHIPKNTVAYTMNALIHRDPTYWKNPDDFEPSRFLDANGKFIQNCDGFQAFGVGKRHCIGEQFARMELYLILGALLQSFTFRAPEDQEMDLSPRALPAFHFPNRKQRFVIKLREK